MSESRCIMVSIPEDYPVRHRDRISNAIKQYKSKYFNRNDGVGTFYLSDYYSVVECSKPYALDLVMNALMAGFTIGYRRAKRDGHKIKDNNL